MPNINTATLDVAVKEDNVEAVPEGIERAIYRALEKIVLLE